jgi:hypothetical protein
MATKAERFRYDVERSTAAHPNKPKKKKTGTARPKTGAAKAQAGKGRKAVVALEQTPPSVPPSRKSTRKSKHRQKAATALTSRTALVQAAPHTRHDQGRQRSRAAH